MTPSVSRMSAMRAVADEENERLNLLLFHWKALMSGQQERLVELAREMEEDMVRAQERSTR